LGFRAIESARLIDWHGESEHAEVELLLRAVAARAGQPSHHSQSIADAYFTVQREIVDEHTRGFVGRGRVRQALDQFLQSNDRGYFIIRGQPGQGKTALACHLVKERGFIHHFARGGTSRADPRSAIRSMLAQLPLADRSLPDTTSELTNLLRDRLALQATGGCRVVMLVDALDELSSTTETEVAFPTFDVLPSSVFVVVTVRPGDTLDHLLERLVAVPHALYDLEPLSRADAARLIRAHNATISDLEVDRIAGSVEGNPLLLRAVVADLSERTTLDLPHVPSSIEAYFRQATRAAESSGGEILRRVLGLLAAARRPLSLREIGRITGIAERTLFETAIRPIRAYLMEDDRRYGFYHALFADFVRQSLLYDDEIARSHRDLSEWLVQPDANNRDYRMGSLACHLYHSGNATGIMRHIDGAFLGEKVRAYGYGVLEDMELLSRSYLDTGDSGQLQECVKLVETLEAVVGREVIEELVKRPLSAQSLSTTVAPAVPTFAGIDAYVGMRPSHGRSADFAELFVVGDRLFGVVGDVPGWGLKSAFIARFVANLARQRIEASAAPRLDSVLADIRRVNAAQDYFGSVTIQMVEVNRRDGILGICNGGHPYPVRYSARARRCDRLPVRGAMLSPALQGFRDDARSFRHVEIEEGDIVVLFSDGLTQEALTWSSPYGNRFETVVKEHATERARAIGEAILEDWAPFSREAERIGHVRDDVTVVILAVRQRVAPLASEV
jgi:hypothetical protein